MTAHYCPDCLYEVPVRKPGKDGRCDWCRSQVGYRQPDIFLRGYDHEELLIRLGRTR